MPRSGRRGRGAPGQSGRSQSAPAEAKSSQTATEGVAESGSRTATSAPELLEEIERAASRGNMQLVQELIEVSTSYSGPIPLPKVLKGYEDLVPGSAARIMGWAENQTKHRHKLEADRARAEIEQIARGQHYALTIGISVILGAVACAWLGHPWVSGILSISGFGAIGASAAIYLFRSSLRRHSN